MRKVGMNYCDRCSGEFSSFETAGKCPLCGQWLQIDCAGCGHTAPSTRFIAAGDKCPKCGRDAEIPGRTKTSKLLIAALIGVVGVFALLIYLFATIKTESRPLPDIPTRSTQLPN